METTKKDETDKKDREAGHAFGKWRESIEKDAKMTGGEGRRGVCVI